MDFPSFLSARRQEIYEQLAGLSQADGLETLEQRFAALATPSLLRQDEVQICDREPAYGRRARLRYVERVSLALSLATRDKRAVARKALGMPVEIEGKPIGLRALPALISAELDLSKRRFLQNKLEHALAETNPAIAALWCSLNQASLSLSGQTYLHWIATAKQIDVTEVSALARNLLEATDKVFEDQKVKWARYVGLDPLRIDRFDTTTLFRGVGWDAAFPPQLILEIAGGILELFDRRGSNYLRFDLESRPSKTARPFLAPVQVPDQLIIVARPSGGHRDAEGMLHELGHALCFLEIPASYVWEDRLLWSDDVAEASAYLVAGLLRNTDFLVARCGFSQATANDYTEYANFLELWMVRRYAARVLHEFEWHQAGCRPDGAGYSRWQARALGVDTQDLYFLPELDEGLYAADYFQAWLLEAELHEVLMSNWGMGWWRNGKAGDFLKDLWSQGGQLSRERLLSRLGISRMSIQALVSRHSV